MPAAPFDLLGKLFVFAVDACCDEYEYSVLCDALYMVQQPKRLELPRFQVSPPHTSNPPSSKINVYVKWNILGLDVVRLSYLLPYEINPSTYVIYLSQNFTIFTFSSVTAWCSMTIFLHDVIFTPDENILQDTLFENIVHDSINA